MNAMMAGFQAISDDSHIFLDQPDEEAVGRSRRSTHPIGPQQTLVLARVPSAYEPAANGATISLSGLQSNYNHMQVRSLDPIDPPTIFRALAVQPSQASGSTADALPELGSCAAGSGTPCHIAWFMRTSAGGSPRWPPPTTRGRARSCLRRTRPADGGSCLRALRWCSVARPA